MNNETAKTLLRYTLTPQIVPRVQNLFFSGFSYIAFFMAQIYNAARLLPVGHPYLSPSNIGRYGIRHVVVEAASVLSWKRENIDQIIIFFLMLLGIVLLGFQIVLLSMTLFVQAAHAMGPVPDTFAAYFLIPDATHDVAFVLLDRVFGVPNMFVDAGRGTTCVVQGVICFDIGVSSSTPELTADGTFKGSATASDMQITYNETASIPWPWPFHDALHKLLEAYSVGILLIAVFIFLYFVIAIVAETAQSGTPFGRRFNHVWAPLRLVAALGMLVPLTHGLNSGQYILLFAAKWGSGFATNGWVLFSDTATTAAAGSDIGDVPTLLGQRKGMVSDPNAPPVNTLIEFASVLAVCRIAYERMYHRRTDRIPAVNIDAYLVNPTDPAAQPPLLSATDFLDAVRHFNGGDIEIVFGEYRDDEYQTRDGHVSPMCGSIILQLPHLPDVTGTNDSNPGADYIIEFYYRALKLLWGDINSGAINPLDDEECVYDTDDDLNDLLDRAEGKRWMEINRTDFSTTFDQDVRNVMLKAMGGGGFGCLGKNIANRYLPIFNNPNSPLPSATFLDFHRQGYQYWVDGIVQGGAFIQLGSSEWMESLSPLGWGGAAIWYNKIAELNGTLISAAYSLPAIKAYPAVMEKIRAKRASADTDTPGATRHQLYQGPDVPITLSDEEENEIAKAMFYAQTIWMDHYADKKPAGNIYIDIVNAIFGTSGLFDMQRNADEGVHPLAQLASVGRSIVDTAIRNLGYSAAAGLGGGIINLFGVHIVGQVGMAASSFLLQVAMVGLSIGFVLFYIVPLLPFIYFFFAVGGWVKGIFEAMVGVPLWALAHIRIDGHGLPGDAALGGYYLILEVFLRPILIIFGFLASITIFSAQVQILHEIWPIVVSNVTGFDMEAATKGGGTAYDANQTGGLRFFRGAVDKFFFTVIYAIVVYMLGMASFKMIDLVPNHILRWMGASVSTFGDQSGDPADNLIRNAYMGASMTGSHMSSALSQGAQAGGQMPGAIKQLASRSQP